MRDYKYFVCIKAKVALIRTRRANRAKIDVAQSSDKSERPIRMTKKGGHDSRENQQIQQFRHAVMAENIEAFLVASASTALHNIKGACACNG
jgi:hypothetical protein